MHLHTRHFHTQHFGDHLGQSVDIPDAIVIGSGPNGLVGAKRRGFNEAVMAVAYSMVVAAWHVLTNDTPYVDLGADYYEKRVDPEREKRRHNVVTSTNSKLLATP